MRKTVIFIADSLDNAHKFQQVLSSLDVAVVAGSSVQFKKGCSRSTLRATWLSTRLAAALCRTCPRSSRLCWRRDGFAAGHRQRGPVGRFPPSRAGEKRLRGARAGPDECAARIRQLLWPGNEGTTSDVLAVDNMTINLATYQVTIGGDPLDLTYLEYALLAFLVTHPGRTYSRDALLRRVLGLRLLRGKPYGGRSRSPRSREIWGPTSRSIWRRFAGSAIFGARDRRTSRASRAIRLVGGAWSFPGGLRGASACAILSPQNTRRRRYSCRRR